MIPAALTLMLLAFATRAFQRHRVLEPTGLPSDETWAAFGRDQTPALSAYRLTPEDLAGPFRLMPEDMMEKARLPRLDYSSAMEALAERFHTSPDLLPRLNPGGDFRGGRRVARGAERPLRAPGNTCGSRPGVSGQAVRHCVRCPGRGRGALPASIGSEHDPLPIGAFAVTRVPRDTLLLQPRPLLGRHARPSQVGKTQSHVCIRPRNWGAAELADLVSEGTPLELVREGS